MAAGAGEATALPVDGGGACCRRRGGTGRAGAQAAAAFKGEGRHSGGRRGL